MSINGPEVFVRSWVLCVVVASTTTGCLSSHTSAARHAAEAELNRSLEPSWRAEREAAADAGSDSSPKAPQSVVRKAPPAASSCEEVARVVALSHPRVLAARERARAELSLSHAEGALPPPEASFEIWDFPIGDPSRADEEGMYMFGVGQKFPASGVRDGRARSQAELARAEAGRMIEARRLVWSEVLSACADWAAARLLQERLADHRALVASMRDAILARYRAGGDALSVLARADAELAAADRHIASAEAEVLSSRGTLLALVGEQARLPSDAPPIAPRAALPDADSLVALAERSRGDVKTAAALRESALAERQGQAAGASRPDFEVRATYMQTPSERAGLGAMVGMSLPWLWGGADERVTTSAHVVSAAVAEESDVRRTLRVEIARGALRVSALRRSLEVLQAREIPAAKAVLEAERASFLAGNFDLVGWISAAHALREAHVDEARLRGDLERAYVSLEGSLGAVLPPAGGGEP